MVSTKLKEILIYRDELIPLKDKKEYITIKVKRRFGGLEERDRQFGKQILTKKQYKLLPHSFIISRVQCWHQAYAIVPDDIPDNMIASINYDQFEISSNVDIRFFWWLANSTLFTNLVRSCASGIVKEKMVFNRNAFLEKEILLPPLKEQIKISKRIDKVHKECLLIDNRIIDNIATSAKLRQAILQEAVQGKLIKQNKDDESAEKLLQRIKAEKQKLIAAGKLKKEKELPSITEEEIPFELPKGWVWCRLGEIINLVSGVTLGKTYKEELVQVPYLRVANVQRGYVDISHLKELAVPKSEIEKYALEEGDLVMIEGGDWDKVGRCAIWNGEVKPCIHQNHIFRLRFYGSISNQWAELFLNSPVARRYFESCSKQTTNLASINKTQLTRLLFALPPLSEQQRIVAKVQQLLQMVNQLEKQVVHCKTQAGQLLQAVLKEAFTGKGKIYAENEMLTLAAEE